MKKQARENGEEMQSEYRFDYSRSKPNRFAPGMSEGSIAVVLDPDVAAVFRSSEEVNTVLRSVMRQSTHRVGGE